MPAMPHLTLTTDFGSGSHYAAAMKGVILSIHPAATIVDLSHEIPPQDIRSAALLLDDAADWFPPETIHVAVVDPGVGTDRAIVYARIGQQQCQRLLCPEVFGDNLAGLHARRRLVEPRCDGQRRQEREQSLARPRLGAQIATVERVTGFLEDGALPGVAGAAGLLVEDQVGHASVPP